MLLAAAAFGGLAAPWLAPAEPNTIDLAAQLQAPGPAHPLGADFYGRDLLSRLLWGARTTLSAGATGVLIGATGGLLLGLLAGFDQGALGLALVALIDLMLAFPALLLALLVVALLGPSLPALSVAVGIAGIPNYARLVRSLVLAGRSAPYVDA
ncbi:MAG: hypothetical protein GX552_18825, partial [Chloroflexi bacterium]|nr:hypothetical protein [Chloroflexota bacterium]